MTRRITIASLALLAGCVTIHGRYDEREFAPWPIDPAKKLDGCATVRTTAEQDAYVWRGRSTDYGRLGIAIEVPLGVVTREAALRVFGDLFRGGAAPSSAAATEPCRVVISPRPDGFSWKTYAPPGAGFQVAVWVDARLGNGDPILARRYASGPLVALPAHGHDGRATIPRSVHIALQTLMLGAAADVKAALEGGAPSPPAGAPPRG